MAFDFKKEYKDLYMPKATPVIIEMPGMKYIAINGCGKIGRASCRERVF